MGLKKFVRKIGRTVKKVAPYAAAGAAAYVGGRALGSVFGGTGGATSAGAATTGRSQPWLEEWGNDTLPRQEQSASTPNWFRENSGALMQGGLSFLGGSQANAANAKMAQQQMDFQREMSNTSYQRGTGDMMAAGLNPMLAYSQGGASAPGGASASMEDTITPAISSARQAQMQKQQLLNLGLTNEQLAEQTNQIKAQTDQIYAQTKKTQSETVGNDLVVREITERINNIIASGDLTKTQESQLRRIGPYLIQQASLGNTGTGLDLSRLRSESEFYDTVGGWAKAIPSVTGALSSAGSGIRYLLGNTTSKKIGGLTVKSTTRPGR